MDGYEHGHAEIDWENLPISTRNDWPEVEFAFPGPANSWQTFSMEPEEAPEDASDLANRAMRQEFIRQISSALVHGILEPDDDKVEEWAQRAERVCERALDVYDEATVVALVDQAKREAEEAVWRLAR